MAKPRRQAKSAKELRRKPASRSIPDRILIVTEGSRTEPAYFRELIAELGLTTAHVTVVGDGGSAPISVVEEARARLKQDSDFEQIYCVFDRDSHTSYNRAIKSVEDFARQAEYKKKSILAIPSVPSFEFWYLLHVSDSRKPYGTTGLPCDALIADLKKYDPFYAYDKKDCRAFFKKILGYRSLACKRAEDFLIQAKNNGEVKFHEDPSTRVHIIVTALQKINNKENT